MTAAGTTRDLASLVGTVLDGTYRLDQLIGEGGMGAVFRGRHVIMKRDFAIKVLHPDFNRDVELVRRFDREAQSAARLRAFRQTLGWCRPDLAALRGLPEPQHQRLRDRLVQGLPDSAGE